MPSLYVHQLVNRPKGEVFAAASDLTGFSDYVRDVISFELLTSGPVGENTCFLHTRKVLGIKMRRTVTLIDWKPPLSFTARFSALGQILDSVHLFEDLPPDEANLSQTRFTLGLTFKPKPFSAVPALFIWYVLRPYIRSQLHREINDVKLKVENRQSVVLELSESVA